MAGLLFLVFVVSATILTLIGMLGGGAGYLIISMPIWVITVILFHIGDWGFRDYVQMIADPIVEKAIRKELKKPTGELTEVDLEKVTKLDLYNNQLNGARIHGRGYI
jgi:hypothetical protein